MPRQNNYNKRGLDGSQVTQRRVVFIKVAASRGVKLGGTVATVGFPNIGLQGFAPKLAKGEIAALSGAGDDARYFQISVPVQPGNSGGALVDERGNVVGVVSAKLNASRRAVALSGTLPGECELRGEEQLSSELPGVRPGGGEQTQRGFDQGEEV
ncbi:MAG: serine protease [Verrucomicrobiota bacterium]